MSQPPPDRGSILHEFKTIEKSIAASLDKLSHVDPAEVQQFADLTYTEVTNLSYLMARARQLQNGYFPFTEKIKVRNLKGQVEDQIVPLTFKFGQSLEFMSRFYMEAKISLGRKSRNEARNVAQSFGGGQSQERQGYMSRIKGAVGKVFG